MFYFPELNLHWIQQAPNRTSKHAHLLLIGITTTALGALCLDAVYIVFISGKVGVIKGTLGAI